MVFSCLLLHRVRVQARPGIFVLFSPFLVVGQFGATNLLICSILIVQYNSPKYGLLLDLQYKLLVIVRSEYANL